MNVSPRFMSAKKTVALMRARPRLHDRSASAAERAGKTFLDDNFPVQAVFGQVCDAETAGVQKILNRVLPVHQRGAGGQLVGKAIFAVACVDSFRAHHSSSEIIPPPNKTHSCHHISCPNRIWPKRDANLLFQRLKSRLLPVIVETSRMVMTSATFRRCGSIARPLWPNCTKNGRDSALGRPFHQPCTQKACAAPSCLPAAPARPYRRRIADERARPHSSAI